VTWLTIAFAPRPYSARVSRRKTESRDVAIGLGLAVLIAFAFAAYARWIAMDRAPAVVSYESCGPRDAARCRDD